MKHQLNFSPEIHKVSHTAYPDGSIVEYSEGMRPEEAKQTLAMIRARKMKLIKKIA